MKLYTTINEFKESLNNYNVLFFGYPEGALVKDDKNNYYFYTYDYYNEERYEDYLTREEIDTDEDGINKESVPMGEDLNNNEILENYLNDTLPEINNIDDEVSEVDTLYKIHDERTYNMLFDLFDDKYKDTLKKYRNEIV